MKTYLTLILIGHWAIGHAQPGTLDNSFSGDGRTTVDFDNGQDRLRAVALQADGGILAAGETGPTDDHDIVVVRLLPNGDLDATFGNAGHVVIDIAGSNDDCNSVVVTADGGVVLGGSTDATGTLKPFLVKLLPNGGLDPAFGANGIAVIGLPFDLPCVAMVLQPNGKFLLTLANTPTILLVNNDGTIDTSFGTNGLATLPIAIWLIAPHSMAIGPGGEILLGGENIVGGTSGHSFWVGRMLPDGSADPSFGAGEAFVTTLMAGDSWVNSLSAYSDGRVLAHGRGSENGDHVVLARYLNDGTLDNSFGTDGLQFVSGYSDFTYEGQALLQPDGKILVIGSQGTGPSQFLIKRLLTNGSTDASFGSAGETVVSIGSTHISTAVCAMLDANGDLVVGGFTAIPGGSTGQDFALARMGASDGSAIGDHSIVEPSLLIAPNPVDQVFTVSSSLPFDPRTRVVVLDALGREMVAPFTVRKASIEVDASALTPGAYTVALFTSSGVLTRHFAKQ